MVLFPIQISKSKIIKNRFQGKIGVSMETRKSSKQTNLFLWIYISFWILYDAQKIENNIFISQEKKKDLESMSEIFL